MFHVYICASCFCTQSYLYNMYLDNRERTVHEELLTAVTGPATKAPSASRTRTLPPPPSPGFDEDDDDDTSTSAATITKPKKRKMMISARGKDPGKRSPSCSDGATPKKMRSWKYADVDGRSPHTRTVHTCKLLGTCV